MTRTVLNPGCSDWSVMQRHRATFVRSWPSEDVFGTSEERVCALFSASPMLEVVVGEESGVAEFSTQKVGLAITLSL